LQSSIARTFAALNATNEAILYAKSPAELYEKVCEAAFSSGDFLATAVFLLEPGTNMLRFAAGFGEDTARLRSIDISIVADTAEGSGVCGQAFRDQKLCISNDFLNEARSLAWRQGAVAGQVGAAAGLPLTCNGRSVGVFLVTRHEPGSIDGPIVALLERMSANLSFALDNFDHEASRKDGERAMRRLNRMFGAISATNEAILRAKTEQDLYQRVCDAAVYSGKSVATVVLLAEPGSTWLKPAAGSGVFSTREQQADAWFLGSADSVRCFFEADAFDAAGRLAQPARAKAATTTPRASHPTLSLRPPTPMPPTVVTPPVVIKTEDRSSTPTQISQPSQPPPSTPAMAPARLPMGASDWESKRSWLLTQPYSLQDPSRISALHLWNHSWQQPYLSPGDPNWYS